MNRELYGLLIGLVTLLALLLPDFLFIFVVALLSALMSRELERALELEGVYPLSFFLVLIFYVATSLGGVFTALFALLYGYRSWNLQGFFKAFFVLFYSSFFPSYLILLREESFYLILTLVLAVWANDVVAYYVGKRVGKTPLFPKLSPNKTLEGFAGGTATGTLVIALLLDVGFFKGLVIGFLTISYGVVGDYFKSFIKRQLGIKDFSGVLGGHGGFVDRFDSLVFCAPLFYFLTRG